MKLFKDVVKSGNVYRIVNDRNHSFMESLPSSDALEKYGECVYYGGYDSGIIEGGHEITVWLDCWN